jgi:putative DNA primase/helicase
MEFSNTDEIIKLAKTSKTEQAQYIANCMVENVKYDAGYIHIYNPEGKLWKEADEGEFYSYLCKYLCRSAKSMKTVINGVEDKRIDKLLENFDNKAYIKDIQERMYGDLQCNGFVVTLDAIKDHLPIKNGKVFNLKTLDVRDRTKEDRFTFELQVEYVNKTPNADKFFSQIMSNETHREYLRKICGYCLTGETDARVFFIWYGSGSNGKSVVMTLMHDIMNDFFVQLADAVFQKTKDDGGPSPHLAELKGKRLGFYSEEETSDNMEINFKTLKRITGEDDVKCRYLFKNMIEFKTDVKLIMATNYTPRFKADKASLDRTKPIFFDNVFSDNPKDGEFEKDEDFINKLRTTYLSEVFSWIAKGSQEYYKCRNFLNAPQDFNERTKKMFENEDSIHSFITKVLTISKNKKDVIKRSEMFEIYKAFCDGNSQRCCPRSELFERRI